MKINSKDVYIDQDYINDCIDILKHKAKLLYTLQKINLDLHATLNLFKNFDPERQKKILNKIIKLNLLTLLIPDPIVSGIIRSIITITGYTLVSSGNDLDIKLITDKYHEILDELQNLKNNIL